jgi:DNA repair photolyase
MPVVPDEPLDEHYRLGYVTAMTLGDGTFRYQPGWRSDKRGFPQAYWRVALSDPEPLARLQDFLTDFGVTVEIRPFNGGRAGVRPMQKVETRALRQLAVLHDMLRKQPDSRSYRRGFLAGFFDAEGHNRSSLRISQKDLTTLERVRRYAASLGFEMRLEAREPRASTLRLVGSIRERIRFFSTCVPAIRRKGNRVFDRQLELAPEPIEAIEPAGTRDVVDIQTSTGTFYAAGLATHNCYPKLLRRALAAPGWRPRVVAMSGVTDPYQPAEQRLRITRGCLEVLAEFRNPVAIVTKSALVARDVDLLAELARVDAAAVSVSLTTLDDELRRRLEPRAASPRARLEAIERLARAGVPTGVMVAPVIPGLNDAEIPAIVAAAAEAGARSAAWIMLRLPHGVSRLFEAWLERHLPERRAKVMNRLRALRGGRVNDPRFHSRMRGDGAFARQVEDLFALACRRAGVATTAPELSTAAFRRAGDEQLPLL